MKCEELKEVLTAMVDGEVTKEEEKRLSLHLKECVTCSNRLRAEKALKKRLWNLYGKKRTGDVLKKEVMKMINERTTTLPAVVVKQFPLSLLGGIGLVFVLMFFIYIYFYQSIGTEHFPEKLMNHAVKMIEEIENGTLSVEYSTSDPRSLEEYFKKHDEINFEVPIFDMRAQGYELLGGSVVKINSIPIAVSVYKAEKIVVLNIMFEGIDFEGEEFGTIRKDERGETEFYISSKGEFNSIAWWMGEELCVTVSKLPIEKLFEFAML